MLKSFSQKDFFSYFQKVDRMTNNCRWSIPILNQTNIRGHGCIWSVANAFQIKGAQRQTHMVRSTEVRKRPSDKSVTLESCPWLPWADPLEVSYVTQTYTVVSIFNWEISRDMIKQYFLWDKKSSHCLFMHLHSTMVSAVVSKLKINWSLEFP